MIWSAFLPALPPAVSRVLLIAALVGAAALAGYMRGYEHADALCDARIAEAAARERERQADANEHALHEAEQRILELRAIADERALDLVRLADEAARDATSDGCGVSRTGVLRIDAVR